MGLIDPLPPDFNLSDKEFFLLWLGFVLFVAGALVGIIWDGPIPGIIRLIGYIFVAFTLIRRMFHGKKT